jgi:hypothetical protein
MITWLSSYPRSGNTFLRILLHQNFGVKSYSIHGDFTDIGKNIELSELVGHIEFEDSYDLEKLRSDKKTYYIKTHNLFDNDIENTDKVIYIIRDGRAATFSFNKYQNNFSDTPKSLLETIYGKSYLNTGTWGDHVKSWTSSKLKDLKIIKYEELVSDTNNIVEELSQFLNMKTQEFSSATSFSNLKKVDSNFFQKGNNTAWESKFNEDLENIFWLINYKQMKEFGYEYKIPDEFIEKVKKDKTIDNLIEYSEYLRQEISLLKMNNFNLKNNIEKIKLNYKLTRKKLRKVLKTNKSLVLKFKKLSFKKNPIMKFFVLKFLTEYIEKLESEFKK